VGKPKLLLIAYRAFGDWVYTIPVLPFLFEEYDVHLECNNKVYALAYDDPRFHGISLFNDTKFISKSFADKDFDSQKVMQDHLQEVYDEIKPDRVIDLAGSLERGCIASREQPEFFNTQSERHEIFGKRDYYDSIFKHCGLKVPSEYRLDMMYFSEQQEEIVKRWKNNHISDFLIIVPPLGTCMQKFYPNMTDLILEIVDIYHNAHVYLMGEAGITEGSMIHDRIHDMTGKLSIKQSFLMTKYADYVLGPETGLLVSAGMFGTHKTMLCNTVSVGQVCGKHKNDHSLQSNHFCSPCHKGIYEERDCDDVQYIESIPYSGCVHGWEYDDILNIVKEVYEQRNIYNHEYYSRYVKRAESDIGKMIYKKRWEMIEKYCHGNMKLLDYGCASGAFHRSSKNGFTTSGYDINPNSQYHKVYDGEVDILTMWDVIEHLHDPMAPIKKHNPKYVFLCTPNKHEGVDLASWKHYRPNEHLHYFNNESLRDMLEKQGYRVLEHNHDEGHLRDADKPIDIISMAAVKE
jgi:hypothetical protein